MPIEINQMHGKVVLRSVGSENFTLSGLEATRTDYQRLTVNTATSGTGFIVGENVYTQSNNNVIGILYSIVSSGANASILKIKSKNPAFPLPYFGPGNTVIGQQSQNTAVIVSTANTGEQVFGAEITRVLFSGNWDIRRETTDILRLRGTGDFDFKTMGFVLKANTPSAINVVTTDAGANIGSVIIELNKITDKEDTNAKIGAR